VGKLENGGLFRLNIYAPKSRVCRFQSARFSGRTDWRNVRHLLLSDWMNS